VENNLFVGRPLKVLWICGLPFQVQREVFPGEDLGAYADWSWILGHLPPPPDVELHIACGHRKHARLRTFHYQGAAFHLVPLKIRARIFFLFQLDWLFFRELVRQLQPDVIHGWGTEDSHAISAIRLARRNVVEVQGNINEYRRRVGMPWLSLLCAWSERLALKRAFCVAAENDYSLQSALPMIRTKRTYAIEHPIRPDFLTAPPTDGVSRQILFLGRIEEGKGIWDALEAFEKAGLPDWKLAVVGSGTPADVARLKQWTDSSPCKGRVTHYPRLAPSEIVTLMQQSSVFLLPTRIDTGPTALKESMAMGLWPVCYDNSGPGHYIRKFNFGNLAEDLSVESLTRTLKRAIETREWIQPEKRSIIASQIRPSFDRNHIWSRLIAMYRRVCSD